MPQTLIRLGPDDLPGLAEALVADGLPADDIQAANAVFFRLTEEAGIVGYGGWEGEGKNRLLRSMVVARAQLGNGKGKALLAAIEQHAADNGCERLHLLTTTAPDFFARHGYRSSDRGAAPREIASTAEFSQLCPASAQYMVKTLG